MSQGTRKVVLVTGGSSGIGQATVELFASKGYKVAFTGRDPERIKTVVDTCTNLSPYKEKPLTLTLDFSDPQNGEVAVKKTVEHFGRLDVLVNNAGTYFLTPSENENSYDSYLRMMAINTEAAMLASLAAIEELKKTRGNIIFVSSIASTMGLEKFYGYSASKAAMTMLARCLAIELAPDIRVNVCSPGPVLTRLVEGFEFAGSFIKTTLRNKFGKPEQIASTIYFLASEDSDFINGHDMIVDDGLLIKPRVDPLTMP